MLAFRCHVFMELLKNLRVGGGISRNNTRYNEAWSCGEEDVVLQTQKMAKGFPGLRNGDRLFGKSVNQAAFKK